jgi:energy-coupling factor transporter ATP-binding protein EcfA2
VNRVRVALEPNPFRTAAVRPGEIGFRFPNDSPLIENLADTFLRGRCGQIIGSHGSGKSTLVSSLLQLLHNDFPNHQQLCFVSPESTNRWAMYSHRRSIANKLRQAIAASSTNALLVIDGAEQLSFRAYLDLMRAMGRKQIAVLATSHRPLFRLPILFQTYTSAALIHELTSQQVKHCSATIRKLVEANLMQRDLEAVSNVRDYWFDLYDLVQPHLQPCDAYREQICG